MNVGVFFENTDSERLEWLTDAIDHPERTITAIAISPEWKNATLEEIQHLLSALTHIIVVVDGTLWEKPWAMLLLGYAGGKETPFARFGRVLNDGEPALLNNVPSYDQIANLVAWVDEEALLFKRRKIIEDAQQEITAAGVAITQESFLNSAYEGSDCLVRNFLHVGFSPDAMNSSGVPVLHLAIRSKKSAPVQILLEAGADPNVPSGDRGDNALGEAVATRDPDMVDLVLNYGVSVNHQNKSGQTPIILAVANGDRSIADRLIASGADLHLSDAMGMSALRYAQLFQRKEILGAIDS